MRMPLWSSEPYIYFWNAVLSYRKIPRLTKSCTDCMSLTKYGKAKRRWRASKPLKKSKLVLDWRKRQQARAAVRVTIEDLLDRGLPNAFTPELYKQKCDLVYQHVYESYFGGDQSIYSIAAWRDRCDRSGLCGSLQTKKLKFLINWAELRSPQKFNYRTFSCYV